MNCNNFTRLFGHSILMLSMLVTFALSASAQNYQVNQDQALQRLDSDLNTQQTQIQDLQVRPDLSQDPSVDRTGTPASGGMGVDAMWDLEFAFSASDSAAPASPFGALLGACWTGTEFWVSKWNADTLVRLDANGSLVEVFQIPGVAGITSIATDGTSLYLANAATSIFVIDPVTKALTSTITVSGAAGTNGALYIAYEASLNSGTGGFYTGFFGSDISIIDMTGATTGSIPAATHGRTPIGGVVDNISTGGPYLWVFEQAGTPSDAVISQLLLPAGTYTGVQREVNADLGTVGALAGDLFIATNHPSFPGQNIIGGMLQDFPNILFGFDLDFQPIQVDANLSSLGGNGLTRMPQDHVVAMPFSSDITNQGSQAITSATITVTVDSGTAPLFTESQTFSNVASGNTVGFTSAGYTAPPVPGVVYVATSSVSLAGQTDENSQNDTAAFAFIVTDSTFARDNNVINSTVGLGTVNAGGGQTIMGQNYAVTAAGGTMTSVSYFLNLPTEGDSTWGEMWATDPATGQPTSLISRTPTYIITATDAANGIFLTLPFETLLPLPPNTTVFVGAVEAAGNQGSLRLATSESQYTPGAMWIKSDNIFSGAWVETTSFWVGGEFAHILRANISYCTSLDALAGGLQDNGGGSGSAFVLASGGTPPYTYSWSNGATTDTALFLPAGLYTVTVTDARGCVVTQSDVEVSDNTALEDDLAGINEIKTFPNPSTGRFNVDIELAEMDDIRLEVMDIAGRTLYIDAATRVQMYNVQIDLTDQSKGVYILRVHTTKGSTYRRLVVE